MKTSYLNESQQKIYKFKSSPDKSLQTGSPWERVTALHSCPPSPAPFLQLTGNPRGLFCPVADLWLLSSALQVVTAYQHNSNSQVCIQSSGDTFPKPRKYICLGRKDQHRFSVSLSSGFLSQVTVLPLTPQRSFSGVYQDEEMSFAQGATSGKSLFTEGFAPSVPYRILGRHEFQVLRWGPVV